ncbi:MAG: DNA polymerase III subunit delta [Alphaproteobacteria bacterium]|nr:DNA polymerase III subunit delta [Alphaproteobacteria bacterium]
MKIAAKQLDSFLKSLPASIQAALIYGPDAGQVEERAAVLTTAILGESAKDPFCLTILDAAQVKESPSRLLDGLSSMSLLGGRQLVRVRDASDSIADIIAQAYSGGKPLGNFLLLTAGDLPARGALRKLFEGSKTAMAALACYKDEGQGLTVLIRSTLSAGGKQADTDTLTYLAQALTGDRQLIRGDLEKLLLYMGDEPRITLEDARAAVGDAAEGDVDALINAVASGNFPVADRMMGRLLHEGVAPIQLIRSFSRYFQQLYRLAAEMTHGRSADSVIEAIKPPMFYKQVPFTRQHLQSWDLPALEVALRLLTEGEIACKTTGANPGLMISQMSLKLAAMARRKAASRAAA